ncbi:MAG: VanZ family protein [Lachnospiraceae bacterium]|jgi:glycopeptide antibiotics resistance protein|nr:VanZ family protein [Lachnospiraceae bacterium]
MGLKTRIKTETIRTAGWVLFVFYLAGLVYFMFFAESLGRTETSEGYRYNLEPFLEIRRCIRYWDVLGPLNAGMNLFGNVAAFLPFGFILPMLRVSNRKWYVIVLLSFLCSLCIETLQLFSMRGSFDVDDLMLNTLGGFFGYLCFRMAVFLRWRLPDQIEESLH